MNFEDLLLERKSSILKRWFNVIIESYPPDSSNFLKNNKDQFTNPVGNTLAGVIKGLFEELLQKGDSSRYFSYLNDIIRIRAVQDFSPSQAVSFLFLLKNVIREEIKDNLKGNQFHNEFRSLESEIDSLALLAFDIYMKCKEQIFELKTNETRNSMYRLLQRANLICEIEDEQQGIGEKPVLTQKIEG